MALNRRFGLEFGKSKIGVDSTLAALGILSSLVFLGKVQGIREGTVAAAVLVGYIVRIYDRLIPLPRFLQPKEQPAAGAEEPESEKVILAISRELGSGGHEIGQLVAKELGLSFYDEKLIQLTADQSGFTSEYIQENEQQLAHSLFYSLYQQNYAYVNEQMPPLDALFMVQSKIIREISEKESSVIVGRCADFVLKDSKSCFTVFVEADISFREQRVMKRYQVNQDEARKMIEASDRKRSNYYHRFTGRQWRHADNYNLVIDSSFFGIEKSVEMLVKAIDERRAK